MKLLHLASGDTWGGAERVLCRLVEGALAAPQLEPVVLLLGEGRVARALRALGADVHVIAETGRSFPRLVRDVRAWLAPRAFDVIHAHRYKEILLAALARGRRGPRLVLTVHGLQPRAQLGARDRVVVWGCLLAARAADADLVAVSAELEHRLARRLGGRRLHRIPNPMPEAPAEAAPDLRARLGWDAARPVVGFVGRLEPVKGPDRFVDIGLGDASGAGFVLLGSGSLEGPLRARTETAGAAGRVGLIGEVPDAARYLPQLDVLALPSRHEGLPVVLLEAAACEVPVVAFDVGGVREVVDGSPAARLIPPGDVAAFASAIRELLADRAAARAEAARWAAGVRTRFALERILAAYRAVYRAGRERGAPLEPRP